MNPIQTAIYSPVAEAAEKMRAKAESTRAARLAYMAEQAARIAENKRPLVERVAEILAKMPPEQIAAGIRLEDVAAQITGKHVGRGQPGAVGEALRQLGYIRVREWRNSEQGFRSRWFKSTTHTEEQQP